MTNPSFFVPILVKEPRPEERVAEELRPEEAAAENLVAGDLIWAAPIESDQELSFFENPVKFVRDNLKKEIPDHFALIVEAPVILPDAAFLLQGINGTNFLALRVSRQRLAYLIDKQELTPYAQAPFPMTHEWHVYPDQGFAATRTELFPTDAPNRPTLMRNHLYTLVLNPDALNGRLAGRQVLRHDRIGPNAYSEGVLTNAYTFKPVGNPNDVSYLYTGTAPLPPRPACEAIVATVNDQNQIVVETSGTKDYPLPPPPPRP
ncbi:MAG: hypothetical protein ACO1SV_00680 [Fimbriimonas sp.]